MLEGKGVKRSAAISSLIDKVYTYIKRVYTI